MENKNLYKIITLFLSIMFCYGFLNQAPLDKEIDRFLKAGKTAEAALRSINKISNACAVELNKKYLSELYYDREEAKSKDFFTDINQLKKLNDMLESSMGVKYVNKSLSKNPILTKDDFTEQELYQLKEFVQSGQSKMYSNYISHRYQNSKIDDEIKENHIKIRHECYLNK